MLRQVLTTLLQSGFSPSDLGQKNVQRVANYIEGLLERQNGLVGFGNPLFGIASARLTWAV